MLGSKSWTPGAHEKHGPESQEVHEVDLYSYHCQLDLKMAALGLHHGLDPEPEGFAGVLDEVLRHLMPLGINQGLQSIHTGVGSGTGPPLHYAPDAIVQGIAVWRGRRPH